MSGTFLIFIEQTTDEHLAVWKALCGARSLGKRDKDSASNSQAGDGAGLRKGLAGTAQGDEVEHGAPVLCMEAGTELADLGAPDWDMGTGKKDLKSSQCWGGQSSPAGQRPGWLGKGS